MLSLNARTAYLDRTTDVRVLRDYLTKPQLGRGARHQKYQKTDIDLLDRR